jgi:uncharacterized SAM-binding protein YcdF (DUF218 family)
MSLFLGKLAAQLALPLSAASLLMLLALLCLLLGRTRTAGVVLSIGLALLLAASNRVLAERVVSALESAHPPVEIEALASADAILLLGGAMQPAVPPREFPEVSEAGDRILHAARLFLAQ